MNNAIVFGIDVSSRSSAVCIMIKEKIYDEYSISNDQIGFSKLLIDLQNFNNPQIVFEATGVYSRRLQAFFNNNGYKYTMLNPLKAKQQLAQFRMSKTDKHDARNLAHSQYIYRRAPTYIQSAVYRQLNCLGRFYEQINHDIVTAKNRLHRILQLSFPEIELITTHQGKQYWQIVKMYPHPDLLANYQNIKDYLLTLDGFGERKASNMANKLFNLKKVAYPSVTSTNFEIEEVRYYCQRLLNLNEQKKKLLEEMTATAQKLPNHDYQILTSIPGISDTTALCLLGELGDIRRFSNPNQLNAFIGIDLRHYESGEMVLTDHISKRGSALARKIIYRAIGQIDSASHTKPNHIADYYEKQKRSSQAKGYKKIAIAAAHKLVRAIYHLIINDQMYDYNIATHNQRL